MVEASQTCQCKLSGGGRCPVRNLDLLHSEHIACRHLGTDDADRLIAKRLNAPSPQPSRTIGKAVANVARKPCTSCGSKKRGVIARAIDRLTNLKNSAINFLTDGMHISSDEQQAKRSAICAACPINKDGWCDDTRGGCGCNLALKVQPRSASCPLGKWSAYRDDYRPLVNPTRHLMFHLFPLKGREWNWHWHIEQIRKHQDKFNGKIVIGVGVDEKTATMEEAQARFEGIRVDHWLKAENNQLAETLTHVEMLSLLQTDDPNAIIFRMHTKGVTKNPNSVEQRWAEVLWTASMHLPSVEDAFASHLTCGVMRSQTPLVKKKPGSFFFAGSGYWMRAKEVFERDWKWKEPNRWIVEYVPSHLFSFAESACIFHDLVPSSVLNHQYFDQHVEQEWNAWKLVRGLE